LSFKSCAKAFQQQIAAMTCRDKRVAELPKQLRVFPMRMPLLACSALAGVEPARFKAQGSGRDYRPLPAYQKPTCISARSSSPAASNTSTCALAAAKVTRMAGRAGFMGVAGQFLQAFSLAPFLNTRQLHRQ